MMMRKMTRAFLNRVLLTWKNSGAGIKRHAECDLFGGNKIKPYG
jgi:hypothetical protein